MPGVFENVKANGWYAVFEIEEEKVESSFFGPPRPVRYNGEPFKCVAASYPFLYCRTVDGKGLTVDTRVVTVTSVLDGYVREWKKEWQELSTNHTLFGQRLDVGRPKPKRKKKEKPDPRTCLRCGGRIVEHLTRSMDCWRYVCRECGFDAGLVLK